MHNDTVLYSSIQNPSLATEENLSARRYLSICLYYSIILERRTQTYNFNPPALMLKLLHFKYRCYSHTFLTILDYHRRICANNIMIVVVLLLNYHSVLLNHYEKSDIFSLAF